MENVLMENVLSIDQAQQPSSSSYAGLLLVVAVVVCLSLPILVSFWMEEEDSSFSNALKEQGDNQSFSTALNGLADIKDEKNSKRTYESEQVMKGSKETDNKSNQWRCACEGGFLPPGVLQSMSGVEAVMRMGVGQCYHKKS